MAIGEITKKAVDAVPIPAQGKREHLWDTKVKGFGLMVTDKGARSYILQYRVGGRGSPSRRVTIGKHGSPWTPDGARKRALELLEQVRRKVDPFDAERAKIEKDKSEKAAKKAQSVVLTKLAFDSIAADYIKRGTWSDGKRIRSWQQYERIIERDLKPHFKATPLTQISAEDITERLQEISERATSASRFAYVVMSNIYAFAAAKHPRLFKAKDSPMPDVPSPDQAAKRDRHLSDDELRLVWKAAGGMGWPWCEIVRLLILTGGRLREVAHAPWGELNLAEGTWLIPGARTKNGDPHLLPITGSALAIWKELPVIKNDDDLVFPSTVGTALSAISKTKKKLDGKILALMQDEAKEAGDDPEAARLIDWRLHDLRRTAAVGMQRRGVPREVIDAVQNHRTGAQTGITGVYQVYRYRDEKAEALAKWDALVSSIITGKGSVVQLRGAA